jgi:hypothetical protein
MKMILHDSIEREALEGEVEEVDVDISGVLLPHR